MSKYILFKTNNTPSEDVALRLDQIAHFAVDNTGLITKFAAWDVNLTQATVLTMTTSMSAGQVDAYMAKMSDLMVSFGSKSWTNVMEEMTGDLPRLDSVVIDTITTV